MITTNNLYTGRLENGKTYNIWQSENGLHRGEILDNLGHVESATIQLTCNDINLWLRDHE